MDFTIKSNGNEVSISKSTVKELISILDKVDCTCVWSDEDNQYIKVHDVPQKLVDELILKLKLAK